MRLGQEVFDAERLRGEYTIESGETEFALAVNEVGNMRRTQPCLASKEHSGELTAIDAPCYLDPKPLV